MYVLIFLELVLKFQCLSQGGKQIPLLHAEPKINVSLCRAQIQRADTWYISVIILNKISWLLYGKTRLLKRAHAEASSLSD